jgi:hypothetical protein
LWKAIHGIDRPSGPTAQDAIDVAGALGYDVHVERSHEPSLWHEWPRPERVASARRRLCVGPDRDAEIEAHLDRTADVPRRLITFWWDRASPGQGS